MRRRLRCSNANAALALLQYTAASRARGSACWYRLKLAVVMRAAESAAVTQSAAQTNELKTALCAVTRLHCWQLVKY